MSNTMPAVKPETVPVVEWKPTKREALDILGKGHIILQGMADGAYLRVYNDFGNQIENFKAKKLDMSALRVSDKGHQAVVKAIRTTERMIEMLKAENVIETTATPTETASK